jgi:hypothetical protein
MATPKAPGDAGLPTTKPEATAPGTGTASGTKDTSAVETLKETESPGDGGTGLPF